jgi:NADH-quinone oxidoreductase subunit M
MVILTTFLGFVSVFVSWKINLRVREYFIWLLLLETGILGVFCSLDFLLFFLFWEVELIPMYMLISIWGGGRRIYSATKFVIYTLFGSAFMLAGILALYFYTDPHTFSMVDIASGGFWDTARAIPFTAIFFLIFIAFAIKLPVFPLHTWLPDAHTDAPTAVSVILAGVLLKMGGYGFLRLCYPIFPVGAEFWAFVLALIGVVSIIYGALCAMAQTDFKKLVAYSSVSHMGYVLLGIAVMTRTGFQGAMFQMIAHGISSPMCFFLVGVIYDRAHHREINNFGGLWLNMPKYGSLATLGFFASLGLPGLCGFIGEVYVLLGTFEARHTFTWAVPMAVLAAFGVILTAGYILWLIQRVYLGKVREEYAGFPDAFAREVFVLTPFAVLAVALGILPKQTLFNFMNGTLDLMLEHIGSMAEHIDAANRMMAMVGG